MVDLTTLLKTEKFHLFDPAPVLCEENKIGQGRFGAVYKCLIVGKGETVYVAKHFIFEKGKNVKVKKIEQNFVREVEALTSIQCDRIIKCIGVYTHQKGAGIILEYAQVSLGPLLHSKDHSDISYHLGHVIRWMLHAAEGLKYLHSRNPPVIHRDIKPDNCLLFDDCLALKIADFGLAREDIGTKTDATGSVIWMAPEVFTSSGKYGPEVDVYSWAVMMWECITRKFPYYNCRYQGDAESKSQRNMNNIMWSKSSEGETPAKITGIPSPIVEVLEKCYAKDPSTRMLAPEIVKMLKEFAKCCWEPKRIYIREDDEEDDLGHDLFDTGLSRATAIDRGAGDTLMGTSQTSCPPPIQRRKKEHVRSRSADVPFLQAILKEELNRSKSGYFHIDHQTSKRSDYSSLAPSFPSIDRRISNQSSVFSNSYGDSGFHTPHHLVTTDDDFQPGCIPRFSFSWAPAKKELPNRPLSEPFCGISQKYDEEATDLCTIHASCLHQLQHLDSDLADKQQLLEKEDTKAYALEEFLKNEATKKNQKRNLRRQSSPSAYPPHMPEANSTQF